VPKRGKVGKKREEEKTKVRRRKPEAKRGEPSRSQISCAWCDMSFESKKTTVRLEQGGMLCPKCSVRSVKGKGPRTEREEKKSNRDGAGEIEVFLLSRPLSTTPIGSIAIKGNMSFANFAAKVSPHSVKSSVKKQLNTNQRQQQTESEVGA